MADSDPLLSTIPSEAKRNHWDNRVRQALVENQCHHKFSFRLYRRLIPETVFAAVREITLHDHVIAVLAGDHVER